MSDETIVLVSCAPANAQTIAQPLIEEKLAACVTIMPQVTSIYRWQGDVVNEQESLLIIKTRRHCWGALEKRIKELHTYSVPEILMLTIEAGHVPYLNWLAEAVPQPIS
jgi:periplasmic divalent cation tolerance protein